MSVDEEKATKSKLHHQRGHWSNHIEFFLTVLGMAVGMTNVWRFPYIAYTNGGGTFLIPYVMASLLVGLPLVFQEMGMGQYAKIGVNKLYENMIPIFKGLAYAIFAKTFVGVNYFIIVMSWCLYYICAGMQSELPWDTCVDDWNTRDCYSKGYDEECNQSKEIFWNFECSSKTDYCQAHGYDDWKVDGDVCTGQGQNDTGVYDVLGKYSRSSAEDYFEGKVLGLLKDKDGNIHKWDDFGTIQWELLLGMIVCYILAVLIQIKGVKSIGKASYLVTILPYIILTTLLIYGLTLPGASDGIDFYMDSDWSLLGETDIWFAAVIQVTMSLGIGIGMHIAMATFNDNDGKILLDATAVSSLNSATSIYAGFAVFATTGFLAYESGAPVESVVNQGLNLAFVSYPAAMLDMVAGPLWSFLFFFMLFLLCFGSLVAGMQVQIMIVLDEFPQLMKYKVKVMVIMETIFFLSGLPFTCNAGIHLFTLIDQRGTVGSLWCCIAQTVGVAWIYGIRNFMQDLSHMELWLPKPAKYFLAVMWTFAIPAALVYLYVDSCIDLNPVRYGMYEYPDWVQFIGLILILMPPIIQAIYAVWFAGWGIAEGWTWREFLVKAFKPTDTWWRLREEKFAVQLVGEEETDSGNSSGGDESEADSDVKE